MTWSAALFDMDGTISDSLECIAGALRMMAVDLGLPEPDLSDIPSFIGPPMHDTVRRITGYTDDADIEHAASLYRAHHDELEHLVTVYPGMIGLVTDLHDAGVAVGLATSKRLRIARRWLDDYGLAGCFDAVAGASETEAGADKAGIIGEALEQLHAKGLDTSRTVMVGDRIHDIEGARAHAIPTIHVAWGYGTPAEAGEAAYRAHDVDQLRELLLG